MYIGTHMLDIIPMAAPRRVPHHLYIPESPIRRQILVAAHDTGHPGPARTIGAIAKKFFWPSLAKDARDWIASCDACQRHKVGGRAQGYLHSLPVPTERFSDLAMDFFEPPFPTGGYDNLLLVVDRLTKYVRIVPARKDDNAETTAKRFVEHVFRHQGLPRRIVSDRGSIWTSAFWRSLCEQLGIEQQLATANHQQTDGQAERAVGVIKTMLRTYLGSRNSDWLSALPLLEYTHNATPHTITGESPHKLALGSDLRGPDLEGRTTPLTELGPNLEKARTALKSAQLRQARA